VTDNANKFTLHLLNFLLLSDVFGNTSNPDNFSGFIFDGKGAIANPTDRTIGANDAILNIRLSYF
jgi:hypothetical protein